MKDNFYGLHSEEVKRKDVDFFKEDSKYKSLKDWSLTFKPNKILELFICGKIGEYNVESLIIDVQSNDRIFTVDGIYNLIGSMLHDCDFFSKSTNQKFKNGFFCNWKQVIEDEKFLFYKKRRKCFIDKQIEIFNLEDLVETEETIFKKIIWSNVRFKYSLHPVYKIEAKISKNRFKNKIKDNFKDVDETNDEILSEISIHKKEYEHLHNDTIKVKSEKTTNNIKSGKYSNLTDSCDMGLNRPKPTNSCIAMLKKEQSTDSRNIELKQQNINDSYIAMLKKENPTDSRNVELNRLNPNDSYIAMLNTHQPTDFRNVIKNTPNPNGFHNVMFNTHEPTDSRNVELNRPNPNDFHNVMFNTHEPTDLRNVELNRSNPNDSCDVMLKAHEQTDLRNVELNRLNPNDSCDVMFKAHEQTDLRNVELNRPNPNDSCDVELNRSNPSDLCNVELNRSNPSDLCNAIENTHDITYSHIAMPTTPNQTDARDVMPNTRNQKLFNNEHIGPSSDADYRIDLHSSRGLHNGINQNKQADDKKIKDHLKFLEKLKIANKDRIPMKNNNNIVENMQNYSKNDMYITKRVNKKQSQRNLINLDSNSNNTLMKYKNFDNDREFFANQTVNNIPTHNQKHNIVHKSRSKKEFILIDNDGHERKYSEAEISFYRQNNLSNSKNQKFEKQSRGNGGELNEQKNKTNSLIQNNFKRTINLNNKDHKFNYKGSKEDFGIYQRQNNHDNNKDLKSNYKVSKGGFGIYQRQNNHDKSIDDNKYKHKRERIISKNTADCQNKRFKTGNEYGQKKIHTKKIHSNSKKGNENQAQTKHDGTIRSQNKAEQCLPDLLKSFLNSESNGKLYKKNTSFCDEINDFKPKDKIYTPRNTTNYGTSLNSKFKVAKYAQNSSIQNKNVNSNFKSKLYTENITRHNIIVHSKPHTEQNNYANPKNVNRSQFQNITDKDNLIIPLNDFLKSINANKPGYKKQNHKNLTNNKADFRVNFGSESDESLNS